MPKSGNSPQNPPSSATWKIAGNSIFLGMSTYLVFLNFGLLGVNAYITSQT